MAQATRATITAVQVVPEVSYFLQLIVEGKLKKIEDILGAIKITTELPALAKSLQSSASTIVAVVTKYASSGPATLDMIEHVVAAAWEGLPVEFTATGDNTGNVRAGLVEMQALVRDEIEAPLRNVTAAIGRLEDSITAFPAYKGRLEFKAAVASYSRWSYFSMDLPCTRKKTAHYEVAGFRGSFDYPEFYACPYGPKKIPWPNHHIPYIKFRIS